MSFSTEQDPDLQTVEQGRLAVVDVRDDREIPKVFAGLLTHWARKLADESHTG